MRYRKCLAIFVVSLLLVLTTGCQHTEDKPLWERLEEEQYNSYKPRLDYMVEKYGDMFEMNVYGDVYCTEPEYHKWRIRLGGDTDGSTTDNFSVRLRRDDIEVFIQEIAEPILGECKVYVCDGFPSKLTKMQTRRIFLLMSGHLSTAGFMFPTTRIIRNTVRPF